MIALPPVTPKGLGLFHLEEGWLGKRPAELEGLRGPMWTEGLSSKPGCVADWLVTVGKWLRLSEPPFPGFKPELGITKRQVLYDSSCLRA